MSLLTEKTASLMVAQNQSVSSLLSSTKVSGGVFVPVPRWVDNTNNADQVDILPTDYIVITTFDNDTYFNLPDPTTNPGRSLTLRNNNGYTLYSSEENIAGPGCGSEDSYITDIIAYSDYQGWVDLVSDGQYWVIVRGYNQAYC